MKKDITFIYSDLAEKSAYEPIAEEAKSRGYSIKLTTNKFEKCEIGFYCQHSNFPKYSKFSIIMLHDIIQQYSNWPNIWYREPWNKYDIGILPSNQWESNWKKCSQWYYARTRSGVYKIGWPKADVIAKIKAITYREEFYLQNGLDINKKTILYAAAWENDGKQDDFVQAMLHLNVNIVIKQAPFNANLYPHIVKNIEEMYEKHQGLPGVCILPPKTNIFSAIAVSDILVSEESSTMVEAAMLGIPAVSVSNWLIPDVIPSRFPRCDYEFIVMTTKEKLTQCIKEMVENYNDYHERTTNFAASNFSHIGETSSMIMDIVDDCVSNVPIRYPKVVPSRNERVSIMSNIERITLQSRIALIENYAARFFVIKALYRLFKTVKHFSQRKGRRSK